MANIHRNIGDLMKKIILVRDYSSGRWGHAKLIGKDQRNNIEYPHYEVRMFSNYDPIHTCTIPSFFIYYEVMDGYDD